MGWSHLSVFVAMQGRLRSIQQVGHRAKSALQLGAIPWNCMSISCESRMKHLEQEHPVKYFLRSPRVARIQLWINVSSLLSSWLEGRWDRLECSAYVVCDRTLDNRQHEVKAGKK